MMYFFNDSANPKYKNQRNLISKFIIFFLKISPYGVIENAKIETESADTERYIIVSAKSN